MTALGIVSRIGPAPAGRSLVVPVIVAAAWVIILAAHMTGVAGGLHHDALIEDGPPMPVAAGIFLVAWVVMVAAMMLPGSLLTTDTIEAAVGRSPTFRRATALAGFLAGFAVVWVAFGLAAYLGDDVVHRVVDATPWLGERPWLISAAILALAGAAQFAPSKRRALVACRHPAPPPSTRVASTPSLFREGIRHGFDCLGASWALMLLMFGEGFASLWWMVALTVLMAYEVRGRHAARATSVSGLVLLLIALGTLTGT